MSKVGWPCHQFIFLLHSLPIHSLPVQPNNIWKNWNIYWSITKINFFFQTRQLLIKRTLQIKSRKISRCKETFSYQNEMIQNKINNLISITIFFLCNKMLSGHKKVKMVLEMKFQDKTKSKRCIKMIVERHYCCKGKGIYSGT